MTDCQLDSPASRQASASTPDWQPAYIGLGANLGDARAALASALAALAQIPSSTLHATSAVYRSAPQGEGASGPEYLNAVALLHTRLAPLALLHALQAIEQAHGRQRPYPNAPRTLDLDLLLHGQAVLTTPELTLPHPRLHLRAFVLQPLLALSPELQAPGLGRLAAWLAATADQPIEKLAT